MVVIEIQHLFPWKEGFVNYVPDVKFLKLETFKLGSQNKPRSVFLKPRLTKSVRV